MKNANQIIKSLQNQPQFQKLSNYGCIEKIKSAFTPPLQKMVRFAYFKKSTLFFVLAHPAGKQEFDNNIQNIKTALKMCMPDECKKINIQDIKAFVTYKHLHAQYKTDTDEPYVERANGDFEVNLNDEKLSAIFNEIKQIIKTNAR